MNTGWLDQAATLLDNLDDSVYVAAAGGQMRHVLEFYECFLDGLPDGLVDYDARRRDALVQSSRSVARARTRLMSERLREIPASGRDLYLLVRADGAEASSTMTRELLALSSHTVHHFAILALTLRAAGFDRLDPHFGVAPSTLRHMDERQKAA